MTLHAILVQLLKDLKACPSVEVEAAKLRREKSASAAKTAEKSWDRGQTFRMAVDYAGYIRGLADCAAVGGWQYLSLAEPLADRPVLENLRDQLACLQQLLPQRDWSSFSRRLGELEGARAVKC